LLFNHQMILSDEPLEPPNEELYGKGAPWEAPELAHFNYIAMFKRIAEVAAEQGILVMMAAHRLGPRDWPGNGLWYNGVMTEERVKESWTKIAQALCHDSWNVFAVDLQNEPHASSWAKHNDRTDWGRAAERLGDHVLSKCASKDHTFCASLLGRGLCLDRNGCLQVCALADLRGGCGV